MTEPTYPLTIAHAEDMHEPGVTPANDDIASLAKCDLDRKRRGTTSSREMRQYFSIGKREEVHAIVAVFDEKQATVCAKRN